MSTPIQRAVDAFGGHAKLAAELGVSIQSLSNWKAKRTPIKYCPKVERLTGIKCEELRPDFEWAQLRQPA